MTGRPYRRARADLGRTTAQRPDRLPPGALQHAVLEHLRAHPHTDFSPAELGNALHRPNSRKAISNACQHWMAAGLVVQTQRSTDRYQATPDAPGEAVIDTAAQ